MSIETNPFAFFEQLVKSDQITSLKQKHISEILENSIAGGQIVDIDYITENIYYNDIDGQSHISFSIETIVKQEFYNAIRLFRQEVNNLIVASINPREYYNYFLSKLEDLEARASSIHSTNQFIKQAYKNLINTLKLDYRHLINSPSDIDGEFVNITQYHISSYNILSFNAYYKKKSLDKFYELCVGNSSPIISCEKDDFIRAFSQQKIDNGLVFLIKGKNQKTSKSSLIYFIDELVSEGVLDNFSDVEYNTKLKYVFRDSEGHEFKNLKQSKYQSTSNPAKKEQIDGIISSILETF